MIVESRELRVPVSSFSSEFQFDVGACEWEKAARLAPTEVGRNCDSERGNLRFAPDFERLECCSLYERMKEPSEARRRTLALQDRAIRFSTNINRSYPQGEINVPSATTWGQLVRAGDGASNNLVEADDASSDADFLHKMRTALREAKESKTCLEKIRLADLANAGLAGGLGLEQEADELSAIFATIIINVEKRLAREDAQGRRTRKRGRK